MKLWHLGIGILLILIVALFVGPLLRSDTDPAEMLEGDSEPIEAAMDPARYLEAWGATQPRAILRAYLPRGNPMAERVVQAFRDITDTHPTEVRAEIYDMNQPGVATIMTSQGITQPIMSINNKIGFEVTLDGRKQKVSLGSLRQMQSLPLEKVLRAIVAQELKNSPPKPASGR